MRFVCESCRAQYMINDEKVGPKGVKVRCRKCGYVILVKRAEVVKSNPIAMAADPDDALATQVMQSPLVPAAETASVALSDGAGSEERTSPGMDEAMSPLKDDAESSAAGPKDGFFGADEDEIGAVFDQVLKSGPVQTAKPETPYEEEESDDDRQSTRVIDAATVRKLAEESSTKERANLEPKVEEVPQSDWYVAINEKQTGPLTLEKVKDHWDRGEITPDSLCWRSGFDDWVPVSEVKMLTGVLAPKPPKPIVVAPAATITQSTPAIVTVPVQSAFSSGGVMQTMQSEMQVPMSASGIGASVDSNDGGWKPSAASALASLVKDEMDALAKPVSPGALPPAEEAPAGGGLLDLVHEEKSAPAPEPKASRPSRPPQNPYLSNPAATYSAPAVTQYRPPSNRNLVVGIAVAIGLVLLLLIGLIGWLAGRPQQVVMQPAVVAVPSVPVAPPAPVPAPVAAAAPQNPPTPAPSPSPAEAAAPVPVPAAPAPAAPTRTAAATPVNPPVPAQPKSGSPARGSSKPAAREPEPVAEPEPKRAVASGNEDDFDKAFGGSSSKNAAKEEAPKAEKKTAGYIPPAPGAASNDIKETLGPGDIMEVVLANKPALAKCSEEQHKKDPDTSGKLVMRWIVQTNGRASNVSVVSEEFKSAPIAACVGQLIKSWQFPKHKKQGEPVVFPMKF